MAEKKKKERFTTPVGEAKWAHIFVPRAFKNPKTGQESGDPKYSIDVVFDPKDPEWSAIGKRVMALVAAVPFATDKQTNLKIPHEAPFKKELDGNDKPTGRMIMSIKTNDTFKPGVFDKYNRPFPEDVKIGNGSKVRVNYSEGAYDPFGNSGGGVSFFLNAVQIIELVKYESHPAESYGFTPSGEPPPDDSFEFGANVNGEATGELANGKSDESAWDPF
jgi:hypothetical protein